jgi:sulfite reductase (ferredoxin)
MLLVGATDRAAVESILHEHGVTLASDQTPIRSLSIACVALPTCSKALGEAERVLPDVVDHLEKLLADTGNTGLPLRLNMTGCPNGCARPYGAELGIVGRTKKNYDIYVGGNEQGDRLAELLRADVPLTDVPELIRPLLERFSADRGTETPEPRETPEKCLESRVERTNPGTDWAGLGFGDWCADHDLAELQALLPAPTGRRRGQRAAATEGAEE